MSEYIEREATINEFTTNGSLFVYGELGIRAIISRLKLIPSADVVEVVRCKDCTHCDPENRHCDHPMGTAMPIPRKADDFCSYGERRTDD